jgi:hypothetical protein
MPARKPRCLRWIEEAEARRLRERLALVTDACSPRVKPPATMTTGAEVPRQGILRSNTTPQTDRDGRIGTGLSCPERNSDS